MWTHQFDAFFARYTQDGAHVWTQQFGTDTMDSLGGTAVDAADHLYATGATLAEIGSRQKAGAYVMFVIRSCDE